MKLARWGITVLCCIVVFGALAAFKVFEIKAAIAFGESFPEHSESVEEAIVKTVQYTPHINVMGEMIAPRRLDLTNELAGEIALVNFESGAPVSKGQILLQLDTSVEEANLEAARARAELADSVYKRSRELDQSKAISKDQLDRAMADLSASRAEVKALERNISKKTLRSPFDGRAGLHTFEKGQFLAENTLITTLVSDQDFIWVDFKVPQFYRRLPAGTLLEVATIGQPNSQVQAQAEVVAENTVMEAANRSRLYRASVPNDAGQFVPHSMVNVRVPVAEAESILEVPALAVQSDPLGQFVFVLQPDEAKQGFRAERRQVNVRKLGDVSALIDRGLKEGERVAAAGAFKLHEGLLVFVRDRQPVQKDLSAGNL